MAQALQGVLLPSLKPIRGVLSCYPSLPPSLWPLGSGYDCLNLNTVASGCARRACGRTSNGLPPASSLHILVVHQWQLTETGGGVGGWAWQWGGGQAVPQDAPAKLHLDQDLCGRRTHNA